MVVLVVLSPLATEQLVAITNTLKKIKQLLDYKTTYLDATIQYHVLDMILNVIIMHCMF